MLAAVAVAHIFQKAVQAGQAVQAAVVMAVLATVDPLVVTAQRILAVAQVVDQLVVQVVLVLSF